MANYVRVHLTFDYKAKNNKKVRDLISKWLLSEDKQCVVFRKLEPDPYYDEKALYFKPNQMEWRYMYWGTKWEPEHSKTKIDFKSLIFDFDLAWNVCTPILRKLHQKAMEEGLTDLKLYCRYADEDIGNNCGSITIDKDGYSHRKFYAEYAREIALDLWQDE